MRILVLTTTPRSPDNRALWEGLRSYAEVDLHFVPKEEQADLRRRLAPDMVSGYDRIVLDLLFRHVSRQAKLLRRIPNLVLYEEDACQEFIQSSKWRGRFSAFYRKLPHARVIFTGHRTAKAFASLGVDACFLPKGYAPDKLYETNGQRDIELGFVGRFSNDAYDDRRAFLQRASDDFGVKLLRTEPGDDYRNMLNRIAIFVSADIGLGEYMAKNFEAMACGCLLLAYRQGHGEEEALGMRDGENVVLYDDYPNFKEKLFELHQDPAKIARISAKGMDLARMHFDYRGQAKRCSEYLIPATRNLVPPNWIDRLLGY